MPVTLCEWTLFTAEYRSRARWDHDCDIFAVRRDRCVGGGAVIRAVCCHPGDSDVNLIKQRADLGRIVGVLVREGLRNYRAVVGIDRQMEFAPFSTRLRAVFRLQPLTRPVDLKAVLSALAPLNNVNGFVFVAA